MRIPIPTVIILAVVVTLTSWFIGTRKMDFAKAPTPEEFVQIAKQWEDGKPHITPLKKSKRQLAETRWSESKHYLLYVLHYAAKLATRPSFSKHAAFRLFVQAS